jgi:hypothetical protein
MPARQRPRRLKIGDRVRSKINQRVGTISGMPRVQGHRQYDVAYDELPQDQYIGTSARLGARLPQSLIERA